MFDDLSDWKRKSVNNSPNVLILTCCMLLLFPFLGLEANASEAFKDSSVVIWSLVLLARVSWMESTHEKPIR